MLWIIVCNAQPLLFEFLAPNLIESAGVSYFICQKLNLSILVAYYCDISYSYLHMNVSMRFLTCEPNLSGDLNYTDEADEFYSSPERWLTDNYFSKTSTLPTHVVMFDELYVKVPLLMSHYRTKYDQCARFFHTHFPEGRISSYVIVLCSTEWIRRSSFHYLMFNNTRQYVSS